MSKCNFSIDFNESVEKLIGKAEKAIIGAGGEFNGNTTSGNFQIKTFLGEMSGSYTVDNQKLEIEVSKKPMLIPCSEIENQLRKYVS